MMTIEELKEVLRLYGTGDIYVWTDNAEAALSDAIAQIEELEEKLSEAADAWIELGERM